MAESSGKTRRRMLPVDRHSSERVESPPAANGTLSTPIDLMYHTTKQRII